jgi:hypothetical protein
MDEVTPNGAGDERERKDSHPGESGASARGRIAPLPGLVLLIHQEREGGELSLHYVLRSPRGEAPSEDEDFGSRSIAVRDPFAYLASLFAGVEKLPLGLGANRRKAAERLQGIGAALARELLPQALLARLSALGAETPAPVAEAPILYLLSNESWVPWEMLRLASRDGTGPGPFLVEAFAVTRWLHQPAPALGLPLTRVGLVVPKEETSEQEGGLSTGEEKEALLRLGGPAHEFGTVPARYMPLIEALAAGECDGWHCSGHGLARDDNPTLWGLQLEGGDRLTPPDLEGSARGLGGRRPLVFLNACHSGRNAFALTRLSGLAEAFLAAGAGAFLGTHWAVVDEPARLFAETFYAAFLGGAPIAQAARRARLATRNRFRGDPTWLAYTVFAYPLAVAGRVPEGQRPYHPALLRPPARALVSIPRQRWEPTKSPGALLRADHGVVPFHGREQDLEELDAWCREGEPVRARLYTGPGGMGKTRLALETCLRLAQQGWRVGFVHHDLPMTAAEAAKLLAEHGGPMLLIVDYAETRRDLLVPLVRALSSVKSGPVRLILLARAALDWWEQLKAEREGVGDFLAGRTTTRHALPPLAFGRAERERSYHLAGGAFAGELGKAAPAAAPDNLDAEHFERVLLIHMAALAAIDGVNVKDEDGILDFMLDRERRFWRDRAEVRGIEKPVAEGIGRAMAAITLGGGVASEGAAVAALRGLAFFAGERQPVLTAIARLLHECYPGERWIEPILPDLLGEHLVMREMEKGADELLELVLGPRVQ